MKVWFTAIYLLLLPSAAARAQHIDKSQGPPAVTAIAEAVIHAEPNQAEIDLGVVTQARSAPQAGKENAEKLARVMAELKKLLGKGDELKTVSYSLHPNYRYPQGGKPEITGYTAANILRIKTSDLTGVGKLIDAAMQSGANAINRLAFTLKDEQAAQMEALRLAVQKAKAKTEAMAGSLGLKVTRILAVSEGERAIRPVVMPMARGAQMDVMTAAPTPVEPGTIEVRSSVTLTGELSAR
jgi:uncharacterized protein YggE